MTLEEREPRGYPSNTLRLATGLILVLGGCSEPTTDGYTPIAFDRASGGWTIKRAETLRNGRREERRMVVSCTYFKRGENPAVLGADACHLELGRMIRATATDSSKIERTLIKEEPQDILYILEWNASGELQEQHFNVVSDEIVSDK